MSPDLGSLHGLQLREALAYGAGSVVYRARDDAGATYAVKRVIAGGTDEGRRRVQQAIREHEVGGAVRHPALRRSLQLWRTPRFGRTREVVLQLEFVPGPTLEAKHPKNARSLCRKLAAVAEALTALHAAGWVHGDVKPGNVLRDGKGARLIDYGIAGPIGEAPERVQGTALPPEQLARAPRTPATDVYCLATTIALLVGDVDALPGDLPRLTRAARKERTGARPPLAELGAALAAHAERRAQAS